MVQKSPPVSLSGALTASDSDEPIVADRQQTAPVRSQHRPQIALELGPSSPSGHARHISISSSSEFSAKSSTGDENDTVQHSQETSRQSPRDSPQYLFSTRPSPSKPKAGKKKSTADTKPPSASTTPKGKKGTSKAGLLKYEYRFPVNSPPLQQAELRAMREIAIGTLWGTPIGMGFTTIDGTRRYGPAYMSMDKMDTFSFGLVLPNWLHPILVPDVDSIVFGDGLGGGEMLRWGREWDLVPVAYDQQDLNWQGFWQGFKWLLKLWRAEWIKAQRAPLVGG